MRRAKTAVTVYDAAASSDSITVEVDRPHVRVVAIEGNRTANIYLDRLGALELIAALAEAAVSTR